MLVEWLMHRMGWTDIWYAHPGPMKPHHDWYAGIWTGPQHDLICVRRCDNNEDAEFCLSPGADTILGAVLLACLKLWFLRREREV